LRELITHILLIIIIIIGQFSSSCCFQCVFFCGDIINQIIMLFINININTRAPLSNSNRQHMLELSFFQRVKSSSSDHTFCFSTFNLRRTTESLDLQPLSSYSALSLAILFIMVPDNESSSKFPFFGRIIHYGDKKRGRITTHAWIDRYMHWWWTLDSK
jgi:hypothetical protein